MVFNNEANDARISYYTFNGRLEMDLTVSILRYTSTSPCKIPCQFALFDFFEKKVIGMSIVHKLSYYSLAPILSLFWKIYIHFYLQFNKLEHYIIKCSFRKKCLISFSEEKTIEMNFSWAVIEFLGMTDRKRKKGCCYLSFSLQLKEKMKTKQSTKNLLFHFDFYCNHFGFLAFFVLFWPCF